MDEQIKNDEIILENPLNNENYDNVVVSSDVQSVPEVAPVMEIVPEVQSVPEVAPVMEIVPEVQSVPEVAPVMETMPEVQSVPEVAPVMETVPEVQSVPEVAPVMESIPEVQSVPEVAPVMETVPEVQSVPEVAPVMETVPEVQSVPEVAPVMESIPEVQSVPEVAPVMETVPEVQSVPEVAPVVESVTDINNSIDDNDKFFDDDNEESKEARAIMEPGATLISESTNEEVAKTVSSNVVTPEINTNDIQQSTSNVKEKKGFPVSIPVIIIVFFVCFVGGWFISTKFFGDKSQNNINNSNKPSENINQIQNSVDINHTVSSAAKYIFTKDGVEKILYLKEDSKTFYYVTNDGCLSGNYGTYNNIDGSLLLKSELYFDCNMCYHTKTSITKGANATETFMFNTNDGSLDLFNSDGDSYVFMNNEDIGNPFYSESVEYCDNLK